MNSNELCVPAGALAVSGEGGEAMTPEAGDEVEVTVTGRVTRRENGLVYLQPVTANGEPIPDKGGGAMDGEYDLEKEEEALRGLSGTPGGSMALLALVLFVGLAGLARGADLEFARRVNASSSPTTNVLFLNVPVAGQTNGMQVFHASIHNLSGATAYAMLFDSTTNKTANAPPQFAPVAVAANTTAVFDFGAAGAPFAYGVNVCLSSTPNSLTNAAAGGFAHVVWSPAK